MRERYKNALMWGLYAALVLLVLVLQTVSFGRPRFFGVKLCFVPVLVACVSMHVGSEAGCVFGMVCGLVWTLSGADGGAMHIVLLALCGAVPGIYLCTLLLFLSARLRNPEGLSLLALIFWAALCFLVTVLPFDRLLQLCSTAAYAALAVIGLILYGILVHNVQRRREHYDMAYIG